MATEKAARQTEFVIEKNVPLMSKTIERKRSIYQSLIPKMRIGDSILFDNKNQAAGFLQCLQRNKLRGIRRKDGNKTRVWRTK